MQRRFALAAALAFTIVVTFAVVTLGTRARLFGAHRTQEPGLVLAAAEPSPIPPAPPAPAPQPQVVTEYVYVDAPGGQRPAPAPAVQQQPAPVAAPASLSTAAAPTAAPPTPAQPSPTSRAAPTSTPPPPAPTAAPQQQASEVEFVGTVTSVDGNLVTFAHGGTSTTVQVSGESLQVGDQAKVHAKLVNGVYVANEIELGGG